MKTYIRIIIGVVVVAALAFAFYKGTHVSPQGTALPTNPPSQSVAASTTPAGTPPVIIYGKPDADWQAYTSASLGFKVKIPKDWKATGCGTDCVAWAPATSTDQPITGLSVSDGKIADVLVQAKPYLIASESLKLGTTQWLKIVLQQPQTGALFTSYFTQHGTKIYEFGVSNTTDDNFAIFGKIINSFDFTK